MWPSPCRVAVFWDVQESAQLERIACSLVDVLEPIWTEVDPAKIACHDDEHVVHFLLGDNVEEWRVQEISE